MSTNNQRNSPSTNQQTAANNSTTTDQLQSEDQVPTSGEIQEIDVAQADLSDSWETDDEGDFYVEQSNGRLSDQEDDENVLSSGLSKQLIECYPMSTAEEASIVGVVCDICLNEYKAPDKVRTIPCLHRFHTRCIDKWLKKSSKCPMCRSDLRKSKCLTKKPNIDEESLKSNDDHIEILLSIMMMILLFIILIPYCLAETWTISVYTGKKRFAGTDSNVYIRLFNSQGESTSDYQLTHYNYIPEKTDFPLRNLFEVGARERFRIGTEDIKSVAKIQIRHDNFPPFQADWLLDQVIVEHNHDGTKYIFKCDCWLRKEHPYITLSLLQDPRSGDKDKINGSPSKTTRTFVIILFVLITLLISTFCCYNEYRRRQRDSSLTLTDTIEQIERESSLLDTCHPQITPRSPPPSSGPQYWFNTIRQWKHFSHGLPSYSHAREAQSTVAAAQTTTTVITPIEQPPAYEDLYPNPMTPINTAQNSNL